MKIQKTYHLVLHLIPSQIPVQTWETAHKFLSFFDHLANTLILVQSNQIPSPASIPPHIQSLSLNPEAVILIQILNLILYRFLQGNLLRGIESCSGACVVPNKILIVGKVGFQSDQITAASWSGNTCQPRN